MIAKMTSHLGQIILAGLVAVAVTFPSPQDAKRAISNAIWGDRPLELTVTEDAVVIAPENAARGETLAYDPAANCMSSAAHTDTARLRFCVNVIYQELLVYTQTHIENSFSPTPVAFMPGDYEAQRLSLAKLCRALWRAEQGDDNIFENPACGFSVAGVEQSASLR